MATARKKTPTRRTAKKVRKSRRASQAPATKKRASNGQRAVRKAKKKTGKPARIFREFSYGAKKTKKGGWDRERRVVAKAEHIDGKTNPRFVVTSLTSEECAAQPLYEQRYCERGNMENRIKEQFSLFADRVSAETIRANQMRLYLSAMAYILVSGLRRVGLRGTELAAAQVSTIRTRLFKIGAQIRVGSQSLGIDGFQLPLARPLSESLVEPEGLKGQRRPSESSGSPQLNHSARISAGPVPFYGPSTALCAIRHHPAPPQRRQIDHDFSVKRQNHPLPIPTLKNPPPAELPVRYPG